ncbi:MAG: methionyl-tRNA formyltransferase [Parcubacteria group bacterium Gr01-1014_29]|nr:MAG: methionyl-tRNA formyltransferase [Parcubacteria group bacterium Gr01-1014_29]
MIHKSPKIIFFGTPQFSVIILQKLIQSGFVPSAVVTAPDKPAGRGQKISRSPVKVLAQSHGIPIFQPEKASDESFLNALNNVKPDVFVIAAYGKILPKKLLDIPLKGTLNVHPSLLPRHRGPSPIQASILTGDKDTGVTLMLTDEKMDHGPIISNCKFQIANRDEITYRELHDKLANLGGELLVETLPKWIAGEIKPLPQNHEQATYTKLLTKEDGHIDWSKSAEEIDRRVRALNPWPGTWSFMTFGSPTSDYEYSEVGLPKVFKRIKILAGHPTNEPSTAKPGTLLKTKNGQWAACTGDSLFVLETVQMEGKKITNGSSFQENSSGFSSFF